MGRRPQSREVIVKMSEEEYNVFIKYIRNHLDEIDRNIEALNEKKSSVTQTLIKLTTPPPPPGKTTLPMYPVNGTWQNKVRYILEYRNVPLSSNEIGEEVFSYEPTLRINDKSILKSITAMLSVSSKDDGIFIKEVNAANEFIYTIK